MVLKVSIFMILFVINPMKFVVFPSTFILQLPSGRVMVGLTIAISHVVLIITCMVQFSGFSKDYRMTLTFAHVSCADG
jgi:F0F1-type ATP synthase membrane subunit a